MTPNYPSGAGATTAKLFQLTATATGAAALRATRLVRCRPNGARAASARTSARKTSPNFCERVKFVFILGNVPFFKIK